MKYRVRHVTIHLCSGWNICKIPGKYSTLTHTHIYIKLYKGTANITLLLIQACILSLPLTYSLTHPHAHPLNSKPLCVCVRVVEQGAEEEWEGVEPNPPDQTPQNPAEWGRKELLLPLPLPPSLSLPPHHTSLPYQEWNGGRRCEEREERWRGVESWGQERREEERGEERGMSCEQTPVRPVLVGRGGDGEREDLHHRLLEENQPTNREQDLTKRVRRQIFQTSEEPQKPSRSRESEREKRTHTQRHTTLHVYTLGNTQPEKERDRGLAAKRNSYPLYTNTLTEKGKNTASHTQTENRRDKHLGMREQAHTQSLSAVGYAGPGRASVPGQPCDGEDERCSVCLGTGTLVPSSSSPLEGHSQTHTHRSALCTICKCCIY